MKSAKKAKARKVLITITEASLNSPDISIKMEFKPSFSKADQSPLAAASVLVIKAIKKLEDGGEG